MSDYTPELQHYQLLDLIGCGGMGYVYNGYEVKSQKPVAIKILSPECTHIEPILIRFKAEGHILRNLNHPNIVKFVEAGQEGQCHFLAMEYISGISLDSLPRSHTMTNIAMGKDLPTMEDYLSIFINCFSALDYIHKQQLVHRDIKPQNIILQGSNHFPRFIDFGIAKSLKNDKDFDEPGERLYTMVYASPEQLTSKPVDYKSDLFSFGVVMYEKLTGNLPFRGKSEIEIFIAQTKWNFPPPRQLQPEIPQKLEQIILKLLSKDPEQRYPTAAMVHGELEKLLDVIRQGQKGLAMSGIIGDIRGAVSTGGGRRNRRGRSLSDEINAMRKARNEYSEAKNQLRMAAFKYKDDPEKIEQTKVLCETLRLEYNRLQNQTKMTLGFESQPLVIDRFNVIFKLETTVFEKRGIPFSINTIEQKLAFSDGSQIVLNDLNFTEGSKRVLSFNRKENCFLSWNEANWFFNGYEEKSFPIYFLIGDRTMQRPPPGFKGFFWPFDFFVAIFKFDHIGVSILENYVGVDRSGGAVFANHKETILFSQNLFDKLKQARSKN